MDGHTAATLSASELLLEAKALDVGPPSRVLVSSLELALRAGEFLAVLGRNGTGKTLTLLTLAGLHPALGGRVTFAGGATPEQLGRRATARRVALLPQDLEPTPELSALELVLLSGFAHRSPWSGADEADRSAALDALSRVGAAALAARPMGALSGGEQRRVAAAATLAQRAPLVLLDEPGNHLDPHQVIALLDAFASHAVGAEASGAVVATMHDPTLAARYATRVLLLHGDGRWQLGAPEELLRPETLSALYLTPILETRVGERRVFVAA